MLMTDAGTKTRRTLYSLNFIFTAISALVTYFNTPFLIERGVPAHMIGLVYIGSALVSIFSLFVAPKIFDRFGNYISLIGLCWFMVAILALLAVIPDAVAVVVLFVVLGAISTLTYLLLDMLLEGSTTEEGKTGATRGIYLTVADIAWFTFPVIAGVIIAIGEYTLLYIVAAAMIVPATSIIKRTLKQVPPQKHPAFHITRVIALLAADKDLRGVFAAQFLLRIFFAAMVIYTPLYLVVTLGISLTSFGSIISCAMLAYIIFELPMGLLADLKWGEKEIMTGGFLVISLATTLLSLASGTSILLWGAILFLTRIGATMVDVTTESYFFKHVDGNAAHLVSGFRMLGPSAYVITPLIGGGLMLLMPIQFIFAGFAAIMIIGIPIALSITDTK